VDGDGVVVVGMVSRRTRLGVNFIRMGRSLSKEVSMILKLTLNTSLWYKLLNSWLGGKKDGSWSWLLHLHMWGRVRSLLFAVELECWGRSNFF
jgi:hypothetical protein